MSTQDSNSPVAEPDIWHDDEGVWVQVGSEALGPFDSEQEAEDAFDSESERRLAGGGR